MTKNEIANIIKNRGIEIEYLSEDEMDELKDILYDQGCDFPHIQNCISMLLIQNDEKTIFIEEPEYKDLPNDLKTVILAHELSHSEGFIDEEKTDFNALKFLNKKQRKFVMKNWVDTHKRKFLDYLNIVKQYGLEKDF